MKQRIALSLIGLAAVVAGLVIINRNLSTSVAMEAEIDTKTDGKRAVLVELFTSEGCSSCPPADELLAELDRTQPIAGAEIIVLSEHVDYWNRLGWVDPFSSPAFSDRQSRYGDAFGSDRIYTPQMIVDGQAEFVGSQSARARSAIASAANKPKAAVRVELARSTDAAGARIPLSIRIENLPNTTSNDTAEVLLALTESGLASRVSRGENAGRRLGHTAVVRKLDVIGTVDPGKSSFNTEAVVQIKDQWNRSHVRAVVFVQERKSRRVLGAAALGL